MSPTNRQARHLLLATVEDPYDVRSWSGIPYALRTALEKQVETLTVFRPSPPSRNPQDLLLRLALGGKPPRWPLWITEATLRANARELSNVVHTSGAQAVLSISSQCIARFDKFPVPTYMFSDAPWLAWLDAYKDYDSRPLRWKSFAAAEASAARRCEGLFFGSNWANEEAERLYFEGRATQQERGRLHTTPLGANWRPEISAEALRAAICQRPKDRLDLLFVGKDWDRKGGPLAVQVVEALRGLGVSATLHIVGCLPSIDPRLTTGDSPAVVLHGALYQNVPEERARLHELFVRSHMLVVPTKAECYGLVFAEAQSFGLPPVSRNIQALPSVVLDGETGLLFAAGATPQEYAQRIQALMADWPAYLAMAESGIERAEHVTNWDRLAETIANTIFG